MTESGKESWDRLKDEALIHEGNESMPIVSDILSTVKELDRLREENKNLKMQQMGFTQSEVVEENKRLREENEKLRKEPWLVYDLDIKQIRELKKFAETRGKLDALKELSEARVEIERLQEVGKILFQDGFNARQEALKEADHWKEKYETTSFELGRSLKEMAKLAKENYEKFEAAHELMVEEVGEELADSQISAKLAERKKCAKQS